MKTYTVVYNTREIDNMKYSFGADNVEHANEKAPKLVNGDIHVIFEVDDLGVPFVTEYDHIQYALSPDGENSKTRQGWIVWKGEKVFVRKHWSYVGGYPIYKDSDLAMPLGELTREGYAG